VSTIYAQEAYSFYKKFILDYSQDKSAIYQLYGFTLQGSVGSKDWEVFAAILMGDRARTGDGADLVNYEVKSALLGNSFEYQYHKNHGLDKLRDDKTVDHIFVDRSKTYQDVNVWLLDRSKLISTFNKWLPELRQNYATETRQRFRRSVTYNFVTTNGLMILEIKDGRLVASLEG
jgi:hypothetical protein